MEFVEVFFEEEGKSLFGYCNSQDRSKYYLMDYKDLYLLIDDFYRDDFQDYIEEADPGWEERDNDEFWQIEYDFNYFDTREPREMLELFKRKPHKVFKNTDFRVYKHFYENEGFIDTEWVFDTCRKKTNASLKKKNKNISTV